MLLIGTSESFYKYSLSFVVHSSFVLGASSLLSPLGLRGQSCCSPADLRKDNERQRVLVGTFRRSYQQHKPSWSQKAYTGNTSDFWLWKPEFQMSDFRECARVVTLSLNYRLQATE